MRFFKEGRLLSSRPNPKPEVRGYPCLSESSPETCPPREALPLATLTPAWFSRSLLHKNHGYDKVDLNLLVGTQKLLVKKVLHLSLTVIQTMFLFIFIIINNNNKNNNSEGLEVVPVPYPSRWTWPLNFFLGRPVWPILWCLFGYPVCVHYLFSVVATSVNIVVFVFYFIFFFYIHRNL